ncbi:hypothetical protein [Halomonas sp. PR-M31]|uniref:hypothetical protein n=1 Tax=Halomonas sp. PR-M31 TaxID=1471202 RepID=UPI000A88C9D5|nr:hypothetical protein [Halomonas sp. PR-M31]
MQSIKATRFQDHSAAAADGIPCLGQRFDLGRVLIDLNTQEPFAANFTCPALVFSIQLGPRHYRLGLDSDHLQVRRLIAGAVTLSPKNSSVKCTSGHQDCEFLGVSIDDAFAAQALKETGLSASELPPSPDIRHPDILPLALALRRFLIAPEVAGRSTAKPSALPFCIPFLPGSKARVPSRNHPRRCPRRRSTCCATM